MSESEVRVTVDPRIVQVSVDLKAPTIIITDNNTSLVTTVQAYTVATIQAKKPVVNVFLGGVSNYNSTQILNLLDGLIGRAQFAVEFTTELDDQADVITGILSDYADFTTNGLDIHNTQFGVIDNQIISIASRITTNEDYISAAQTDIIQNSESITLQAGRVDGHDDEFDTAFAAIQITADDISATITRLDNTDGAVTAQSSSILQNASGIASSVERIILAENTLSTAVTNITQNADDITLNAAAINAAGDRISATEISITAYGVLINTVTGALESTTEMLANRWSVLMTEDGNGDLYSTGFALTIHPEWDYIVTYALTNIVWYNDAAWICIQAHNSEAAWYPQAGSPGSTYWDLVVDEDKTNFIVHVDNFQIRSTDGSGDIITPFIVQGNLVKIAGVNIQDGSITANLIQSETITGDLIQAGTITVDKLQAGSIQADRFEISLQGSLNDAFYYVERMLSIGDNFNYTYSLVDFVAGSLSNIDAYNDPLHGISLRLQTVLDWDEVDYSGTTTSGTLTTLTDSGATWTVDAWINYWVVITGGTGSGQERLITDNDATSLTVADWDTNPDATSTYEIRSAWDGGDLWDIPTESSGSSISTSIDLGVGGVTGSPVLSITNIEYITPTTPDTVIVECQYSHDNINWGINDPDLNDTLWETLVLIETDGSIKTYEGWVRSFRYIKLKISISSADVNSYTVYYDITLSSNIVTAVQCFTEKTIDVGGSSFTLQGFYHTPSVTATPIGSTLLIPKITNLSKSGFTVQLYNMSSTDVGGTASINIMGT